MNATRLDGGQCSPPACLERAGHQLGTIRRSPQRLDVLQGMRDDADEGRHYRYAAAVESGFAQALVDGGYVEVRQEGRHPAGGPAHRMYLTDEGRHLLATWEARHRTERLDRITAFPS